MEKIYAKLEPVYTNSAITAGDTSINLTGVAMAVLVNGSILSIMQTMFAG